MSTPDTRTALNNRTRRAAQRVVRDGQSQLRRLLSETDAQDLVEYALLTALIGFAGAAAWSAMRTGLGFWYTASNGALYNSWEPANPVGGGS